MTTANISDKWQITLPGEIRRKITGLKQHGKVEVEVRNNEIIIRPVKSVREVRGIFHDAVMRKPADWKTIRNETERTVAEQVASEGLE